MSINLSLWLKRRAVWRNNLETWIDILHNIQALEAKQMEEEERQREQQRRQAEEEQRRIAAEVAREQAKTGWGAAAPAVKSPIAEGGKVKSLLEIQKEEAKKQLTEPKKDKKVDTLY